MDDPSDSNLSSSCVGTTRASIPLFWSNNPQTLTVVFGFFLSPTGTLAPIASPHYINYRTVIDPRSHRDRKGNSCPEPSRSLGPSWLPIRRWPSLNRIMLYTASMYALKAASSSSSSAHHKRRPVALGLRMRAVFVLTSTDAKEPSGL
ncbi:unnamed protein product [Somion occarium]|uniref:Uncharacterized protein n=1 Tax=Somion occarium TaxID=3059160 RepID=A0ABP1DSW1_9APHY